MNKFLTWFENNRKSIGYVIGGANIGSGIGQLAKGEIANGVVFVVLGLAIILDTRMFK
jgi:hypothetical protein